MIYESSIDLPNPKKREIYKCKNHGKQQNSFIKSKNII